MCHRGIVLLEVKNSYKTIGIDEIAQAQQALSIIFPEQYAEFLLKHNGGTLFPDGVMVDGKHFDFVAYLYSIKNKLAVDDLATKCNELKNMVLEHYLPFGESPGGDVFCFSLLNHEFGAVYHWDHEEANYDGEPWEYNMTKIADSFNIFIEQLYDCDK